MIKNFGNRCAEDIFDGVTSKFARELPKHLHGIAREKLDMIDAAHDVRDLLIPPGNRLEKLKGRLKNKYSIRINNQWRIVFRWHHESAEDVEIVDYH